MNAGIIRAVGNLFARPAFFDVENQFIGVGVGIAPCTMDKKAIL
jgi:hypothetical protein